MRRMIGSRGRPLCNFDNVTKWTYGSARRARALFVRERARRGCARGRAPGERRGGSRAGAAGPAGMGARDDDVGRTAAEAAGDGAGAENGEGARIRCRGSGGEVVPGDAGDARGRAEDGGEQRKDEVQHVRRPRVRDCGVRRGGGPVLRGCWDTLHDVMLVYFTCREKRKVVPGISFLGATLPAFLFTVPAAEPRGHGAGSGSPWSCIRADSGPYTALSF